MKSLTDAEFMEELRSYCEFVQETDKPICHFCFSISGAVDREKTLKGAAYDGMPDAKKASLLI